MPPAHRIALLSICLIWAGNFIASAVAVDHVEPVTATVLRFLVVAALLWPFVRRPAQGQWLNLLGACWCMGALHFGLLFAALGRSADVSSIAILLQVYVPLSTLLAVVLLGERVGWRTATGIAMAFGGVLIVGLDPLVVAQLDVVALTLASAFSLALGTVFMRRVRGIGTLGFQGWNALLSLPLLALLAVWLESPGAALQALDWHSPALPAIAYSAIAASIVGHGVFYWLIQRHEVARVTPYLLLVPVLAVLLGVALRGDRPGARLMIGGAVVLAGVLWVTLRARYRGRPAAAPRS
jgi:O-acetylserine/cysteine efflux transporter